MECIALVDFRDYVLVNKVYEDIEDKAKNFGVFIFL